MPYPKMILSFIALILTHQFLFGQNRPLSDDDLNHSTGSKIRFADTINCDEIKGWIKSDIKNNTIFLFLAGGIAPVVYTTDKENLKTNTESIFMILVILLQMTNA